MIQKKTSILIVIFLIIGLNIKAQDATLKNSEGKSKKTEIAMVSSIVTEGAANNTQVASNKVEVAMSAVIRNEENENLETDSFKSDKEPRVQMFSITKDSIQPKENN